VHGSAPHRSTVRSGYDRIGDLYVTWSEQIEGDPRVRFLTELTRRLAPQSDILDLGCGNGKLVTELLAPEHQVLGIDISPEQVLRARRNVPAATFRVADLATLELAPNSCDAVVASYSLIHVPRERHAAILRKTSIWLRPGGFLLLCMLAEEFNDVTIEWLGVEMFFSSYGAEATRALVHAAGYRTLIDEEVTTVEPEGRISFLWVLAEHCLASDSDKLAFAAGRSSDISRYLGSN